MSAAAHSSNSTQEHAEAALEGAIFTPEQLALSQHEKVRKIAAFLKDPAIMDRIRAYSERYWDQKWDENW